jgi:hypothetical protein
MKVKKKEEIGRFRFETGLRSLYHCLENAQIYTAEASGRKTESFSSDRPINQEVSLAHTI